MKYVVVIGGTMSGIGKGTLMSSIGVLLRSFNISCTSIKIDPYLNLDAGTMSPREHGEVYVLDDGGEADLDLGNYERFLNLRLSWEHSITTGKIFRRLFDNERAGVYLGKTVQMVPHVVDMILEWITSVANRMVDRTGWREPEICLLEIGGTVGDIESEIYMEAIRQFKLRIGAENICICHLSYVPCLGPSHEQKSKPTQSSVKTMLQRGLQPDVIFCRCESELLEETKRKIALFTQVKYENVISVHNAGDVYSVPLILNEQNVAHAILSHLKFDLRVKSPMPSIYSLDAWRHLTDVSDKPSVCIAIVGKYNGDCDAYLSLLNALKHSSIEAGYRLNVKYVYSTIVEDEENLKREIDGIEGVVVPGGFGDRAVIGKMATADYCRKNKIPFLGICLGFQVSMLGAALEFDPKAIHEEVEDGPKEHRVVVLMPEYAGETQKGSTMRVGGKVIKLVKDTLAFKLYDGQESISERHRHRYQLNMEFRERLEGMGFIFSGFDESGVRAEFVELASHPFYFATQSHPEYNSTPFRPSPPFLGLILAAKGKLNQRLAANGGKLMSGKRYH